MNAPQQHLSRSWGLPTFERRPREGIGQPVLEHCPRQENRLGYRRPQDAVSASVDHFDVVLVLPDLSLNGAVQQLNHTPWGSQTVHEFKVVVKRFVAPDLIVVRIRSCTIDLHTENGHGIRYNARFEPPHPLWPTGVGEEIFSRVGRLRPIRCFSMGHNSVPVQTPNVGPLMLEKVEVPGHLCQQLWTSLDAVLGQFCRPHLVPIDPTLPLDHGRPLQIGLVGALGPIHIEINRRRTRGIGRTGVGHSSDVATVKTRHIVVLNVLTSHAKGVGPTQRVGVFDRGQHRFDGA